MDTPGPEYIATLVRDWGLTEEEARIFDHLLEAARLYRELPEEREFDDSTFLPSIEAAIRILAMRVVKRDHPDGWFTLGEREERIEGEQDG